MSTWRRLADEQFPELKTDALVPVQTVLDLYSELSRLLERSLDANDAVHIQRILKFVLWGVSQANDEQFIHGTVDLFRRVLRVESLRTRFWRHLSAAQFSSLKGYFIEAMDTKLRLTLKDLEIEYRDTRRSNSAVIPDAPKAARPIP